MIEIEVEGVIAVKPAAVWAVFADHEGMHKWTGCYKVVRRRPGTPDPNGVGAVRTLYSIGPVPPLMEERITAFEPGKLLEYQVLKGAPGRNARGQIKLSPSGADGTLINWTVTMQPYIPGTGGLIQWYLKREMGKGLNAIRERLEPVVA